jgi:hypothetical protein
VNNYEVDFREIRNRDSGSLKCSPFSVFVEHGMKLLKAQVNIWDFPYKHNFILFSDTGH